MRNLREIIKNVYKTEKETLISETDPDARPTDPKAILKSAGFVVRLMRESRQMSQDQLAVVLGTSKSAVSRIEAGKQNLTIEYLVRISNALKVPIQFTIGSQFEKISQERTIR